MTELVAHHTGDTQPDASDEAPATALMELERSEADLGLEVARLKTEYQRLRPLSAAAGTLETGVLTGGLLDASDGYGSDRVIGALRASFSHDGDATLRDTYKNLIPAPSERKQFLAGIQDQGSVIHAVERINEIGGTQDTSWNLSDQFERARGFDARALAKRKERKFGKYHTSTYFDETAFNGFSDAIFNQPELFESVIADGGDIVDVIQNLRDTYASGVETYGPEHARVMERIEAAVTDRQRPTQALRDLADNILASEVRQLESTLGDIDDNSQRELISQMLEGRANEAAEKRSQFDAQLEEIRAEVLRELDAEHFEARVLQVPSEPQTIVDTRLWREATAS